MKIKSLIRQLREVFLGRRREGHTTAMMRGALNTERVIVIAADMNQQVVLAQAFPGVKIITLSQLDRLIGQRAPVLIDHHAVEQVLGMALQTILERELKLHQTAADLRKITESIQSYLRDEA